MTNSNLSEFITEGKKMTPEQKMSDINLSNYNILKGFESVIVKRDGEFKTIQAFYLNQSENIYTLDERLISNRIN